MSDLISRQDAIDALEEQLDYLNMLNKDENPTAESNWYGVNWARNTIADLPSAEHKRGEWIQHVNEPSLWSCSICETVIYSEHEEDRLKFHKWCGCCGADMRGRVK